MTHHDHVEPTTAPCNPLFKCPPLSRKATRPCADCSVDLGHIPKATLSVLIILSHSPVLQTSPCVRLAIINKGESGVATQRGTGNANREAPSPGSKHRETRSGEGCSHSPVDHTHPHPPNTVLYYPMLYYSTLYYTILYYTIL